MDYAATTIRYPWGTGVLMPCYPPFAMLKRLELAKVKRKPWIKLSDAFPLGNGGRFMAQAGTARCMDQLEPTVLTNMPVFVLDTD